jgi:hypothetical protein
MKNTEYSGSKLIDFSIAAMSAAAAILVWIPDYFSASNLKFSSFLFYITTLFILVRCLFNGGRL